MNLVVYVLFDRIVVEEDLYETSCGLIPKQLQLVCARVCGENLPESRLLRFPCLSTCLSVLEF